MDKTYLRSQALTIASNRAKPEASLNDILKDAKAVLKFLMADYVEPIAATEPAPSEPAQHESTAAVVGQEPKGE